MNSEWLRIMLDEIARKKAAADDEQAELERRHMALGGTPLGGTPLGGTPPGGTPPGGTPPEPGFQGTPRIPTEESPAAAPVGAPRRRLTGPP